MVIEKTLTLETGEGDTRGKVVIQVCHNTHPSAVIAIKETVWPMILEALIEKSSSITVTEW